MISESFSIPLHVSCTEKRVCELWKKKESRIGVREIYVNKARRKSLCELWPKKVQSFHHSGVKLKLAVFKFPVRCARTDTELVWTAARSAQREIAATKLHRCEVTAAAVTRCRATGINAVCFLYPATQQ